MYPQILCMSGYKYCVDIYVIALFCCYIHWKCTKEQRHEISNVVCATSNGSDQPAHMRSLIRAFASRLNIL